MTLINGREGPGGGQYGFGFSDKGHGLGFEERKVANEKGFTRCEVKVRVKGNIDGFKWGLGADCHQIERGGESVLLGRGVAFRGKKENIVL